MSWLSDAVSDLWDDITGAATDVLSVFGDVTGIDELNINQQIKEAEELGRKEAIKERERLIAQLDSSSAKERIEAKKKLDVLDEAHKKKLSSMRTKENWETRKFEADLEEKQKTLASQEKVVDKDKVFDRKKMLGIRDRAIRTPTIGPRPGQGTVIPRPTVTPPRSGQDIGRRPK
jgi:hypothetical protein